MYRTLKLINGDISFNNLGKLEWIEDLKSLEQTVIIKLNTIKNQLFYNSNYGITNTNQIKNLSKFYNDIGNDIKEALIDDEKIKDVSILNMTNSNIQGKIDVEIEIILTDDTKLNIAYSI